MEIPDTQSTKALNRIPIIEGAILAPEHYFLLDGPFRLDL
jgi:hypothetical protein